MDRAFLFAARAHKNQRYGDKPYSTHLESVMACCAELGFSSTAHLVVAALHDVLEDTAEDPRAMESRFGRDTVDAVRQLTRKSGTLLADYFGEMGPLAFAVKIADRISNLRRHGREPSFRRRQREHLFPKYESEQTRFRTHRLAKHPAFAPAIAKLEAELQAARTRLFGQPS